MPATTLWITDDKKEARIMFITQMFGENTFTVNIYPCNEDFVPFGAPVTKDLEGNEMDYHMKLRKDASEKGHFVSAHSTNPEWNPDYIEPQEETGGHYGC